MSGSLGDRDCFWHQAACGVKPASTLTTCVVLTKFLNLFEPQFPHLLNGNDMKMYQIGLFED